MELTTKANKIKTVADRWDLQYPRPYSRDKDEIGNMLRLKNPKSEDEIAIIIGNRSWTSLICDECKLEHDVVIRLGEEPAYESSTAYICKSCLKKALKMIKHDNL